MAPEDLTQSSGELSTGVQQNTVQAMTQFMGVLTDPSLPIAASQP